jgi:hypothetical protein
MDEHKCTDICRAWHVNHPPRGQKTNSIPAGDKRHISDEVARKVEARRKKDG